MNTKHIGDVCEAMVTAFALKAGWVVLRPVGDNQPYDLVIDRGQGFERVQCKSAHMRRGAISFKACSSYAHRGRPDAAYHGRADLFGVYSPAMDKVYLIPVSDCGKRAVSLRVAVAKNGQSAKVRMAADYEI